MSLDESGRTWTYGSEHELADVDTRTGWGGFGRDAKEVNIVNSNGIAADPKLISWHWGGEMLTKPSNTPSGQGEQLYTFLGRHPEATVNWRGGLHVHVRVPGLSADLPALKRLAAHVNANAAVYELVDPLPRPHPVEHAECMPEARHRYFWMRKSHYTVIPQGRVAKQLASSTLEEFFRSEVPRDKKGRPLWHAQPRAAVNLRQLLQTDTLEFRHFPATLSPSEVVTACEWCRDYLLGFFAGRPAAALFAEEYQGRKFPALSTIYVHWQELRWRETTPKLNKRPQVRKAIQRILEDDRAGKGPMGAMVGPGGGAAGGAR